MTYMQKVNSIVGPFLQQLRALRCEAQLRCFGPLVPHYILQLISTHLNICGAARKRHFAESAFNFLVWLFHLYPGGPADNIITELHFPLPCFSLVRMSTNLLSPVLIAHIEMNDIFHRPIYYALCLDASCNLWAI